MGLYRVRFGAGPLGLQVSPASRGAEGWCRGLVVTGGARAGVRPGDEIVSVNDVDLSGFASDTALAIVAAAADRELTFRHFEEDAYQTGAVEAVCRFEHRGPDFVAFFPDGRVGMTLLPRNADGERCGGLVVDDLAGSKAPIGLQQGDGLRSVNRVPLATFPFSIALEIFRVASARCCVVERSQPNARAHAEPAAVELATAEPVTSAPRPRRCVAARCARGHTRRLR
ncbi:hypothetical protein M885DRAFT_204916 [Pelagophyceae sp. CCMP2097]|nr:hypothetical protein M885DRAFT_204916 [Pelagophyceae sp. CCMP2097]